MQSRWYYSGFFFAWFMNLILDLLGGTGNVLMFPFSFSVPGYSAKGPINSTR
jgi:hypothetical protein